MRFDDIDPDEREDALARRRRRARVLLSLGALAALCLGGLVAWNLRDDGSALPSATDPTLPVEETDPPIVDDVPFQPGPQDYPLTWTDYQGEKAELLAQRSTAQDISVWLHATQQFMIMDGGPRLVHQSVTQTTQAPLQSGWVPEPWCNAIGQFRVTMRHRNSVGSSMGGIYDEPHDGVAASLFSSGYAEGEPFWVMVLQVSQTITSASVRFSNGAGDAAPPKDGFVILAGLGRPEPRFSVTVEDAAGPRDLSSADLNAALPGNRAWMLACNPPVPTLPEPGEQPVDAAAVEELVRQRVTVLYDRVIDPADKPADLLDSREGIDEALAAVAAGPFADAAIGSQLQIDGIVFTSPTQAWFEYTLLTTSGSFSGRFGYANLIDGSWRIGRAVLCQDLMLAGAACNPPVDMVVPPEGG